MLIRTDQTAVSKNDMLKVWFRRGFEFLPKHARGHVVAGIGEFIGTTVFIFMAFAAAQVAFVSSNNTKKGNIDTSVSSVTPSELLYIALGAAFSLAVTAWTFFRISGGLFNPVVSISSIFEPLAMHYVLIVFLSARSLSAWD
jgi:aquaporin related protein